MASKAAVKRTGKRAATVSATPSRGGARQAANGSSAPKASARTTIAVQGARVHNLKNISLEIPRDSLVVMTGLSGSGKSSIAFDTIYAEGQRRYMESLSSYARQFLELQDKPDVDEIQGLSPTIAIDQRSSSQNPRSTVGTITEIYDFLRVLFSRAGRARCPKDGTPVVAQTIDDIAARIMKESAKGPIAVLAPVVRDERGEHKHIFQNF